MVAKDGGSHKVSLAQAPARREEKRQPKKLKPIAATKIGGKGAKVAPDDFPPAGLTPNLMCSCCFSTPAAHLCNTESAGFHAHAARRQSL